MRTGIWGFESDVWAIQVVHVSGSLKLLFSKILRYATCVNNLFDRFYSLKWFTNQK